MERQAKQQPRVPHIRHYIDDVYACIWGKKFNRKLLRHAIIERHELEIWCQRRGIPLPAFWFLPDGKAFPWADVYQEREKLDEYRYLQRERMRLKELDQDVSELDIEIDKLGAEMNGGTASADSAAENSPLRHSQMARIACQQIATALWKQAPDTRIAHMANHEAIQNLGGGMHFDQETVIKWLSAVAPKEVKNKRGRPRKDNPSERD